MFKKVKDIFSLPLLSKELYVLAEKKSTYIVRGLYGILLFLPFIFLLYHMGLSTTNSYSLFMNIYAGKLGVTFFSFLQILQLGSVFLFLPGMMASAITAEKEKNSLELLFTTRLSTWNIILEKFLSRLLPFLYLLLMSLPLMGVIYSLGGVGRVEILEWIGCIFILTFFTGALSLIISVFCQSTTGAMLGAYFFNAIPLALLFEAIFRNRHSLTSVNEVFGPWFLIVSVILGIYFLFSAQKNLIKKAISRKRSLWRRILMRVDKDTDDLNKALAGGIIIINDNINLPANKPVLWREKKRMNIDNFRYCFRLVLIFGLPCIVICLLFANSWAGAARVNLMGNVISAVLIICFWIYMTVSYSTSVLNDISSQTMDVLLTTPITEKEYLTSKINAGYKLIFIFCFILLIPASIKLISLRWNFGRFISIPILVISAFAFLVFIRNVTLLLSLWLKNRPKTILWSILLICLFQVLGITYCIGNSFSGLGKQAGMMLLAFPEFGALLGQIYNLIAYNSFLYWYSPFSEFLYEQSLYENPKVILQQMITVAYFLVWASVIKYYMLKHAKKLLNSQYHISKMGFVARILLFFGVTAGALSLYIVYCLNIVTFVIYIFVILILAACYYYIKNKINKKHHIPEDHDPEKEGEC